jgi:N-acetylglutamate synthase-like GNAT family acetyltransferase
MEISFLQWIGYIASIIIAISMTVSSILMFRWINLAGAVTFSAYGFLIGALPVGFLNLFIVLVDIYYLRSIYSKKEIFEILHVKPGNQFLERFLKFHEKEIRNFFPEFNYQFKQEDTAFFILRDMAVAGIFVAHRHEEDSLMVTLDYVIPEYRDFKNGKFVFLSLRNQFIEDGISKIIAHSQTEKHKKYLMKNGFIQMDNNYFEKSLKDLPNQ